MFNSSPYASSRLRQILMGGPNQPDPMVAPPMGDEQNPGAQQRTRPQLTQPSPRPQPQLQPIDDTPPNFSKTQGGDVDADEYRKEMDAIRTNMPVTSQYRQTLLAPPQRKSYEPSKMRRLGAALAGGASGWGGGAEAGLRTAHEVNDAPYEDAVRDYQLKAETQGRGAQMEEQEAENKLRNMQEAQKLGLSYAEYRQRVAHETAGDITASRTADARVTTANKKHYVAQQMMTGVRMVNDQDSKDYYDLPGETVASVNAKTARSNAGTNAGRLSEEIANNKNTTALRARSIQNEEHRTTMMGKFVAPADQQRARDLVIGEMAHDPKYSDFFAETKPGSGIYDFKDDPDIDDDTFEALKAAVDERVNTSLNQRRDR